MWHMNISQRCCSKILQTVILIILSIVFVRFFGLSTFAKRQRQDVQVVRRNEPRSSLPPPAVTICAMSDDSGWKTQDVPGLDNCKDQPDLEECVVKNTFSFYEVLDESNRLTYAQDKAALEEGKEPINDSLWFSRMTDIENGICHTLIYDQHISQRTYLQISLNNNLTAAVFLHDPKFFVFKSTNVFIPFLKLNDVYLKEFIIIATTKKRMWRESKFECNLDENYNFGECVRSGGSQSSSSSSSSLCQGEDCQQPGLPGIKESKKNCLNVPHGRA